MSTDKNDLAFPVVSEDRLIQSGLTKREIFAMSAMQAFSSLDAFVETDYKQIAIMAVKQADALIEELNKGQE